MSETNTNTATQSTQQTNTGSQQQTQQQTQSTDPKNTQTTQSTQTSANSEKKYTDDEVNALIDKKFAEWQKKKDAEISEAEKLAKMNEQQKAQYQSEQLQKRLDSLLEKDALNEMTKTARKMLSESGVSVDDELLSVMVSTDAEATKKAVDSFAASFKKAVEKAVTEKVKGTTPKGGKSGGTKMTKDQIMQIRDAKERQNAIRENIELFQ